MNILRNLLVRNTSWIVLLLLRSGVVSSSCVITSSQTVGNDEHASHVASFRKDKNTSVPIPFPNTFRIDFVTNVTRHHTTNNNKAIIRNEKAGSNVAESSFINGRLYYDWSRTTQRIDHDAGSFECLQFYQHAGPCSLIFVQDSGMYRILTTNNTRRNQRFRFNDDCCLDLPNLGAPPPNWAQDGTYNGVVCDSFSNQTAHEWVFILDDDNHQQLRRQSTPSPYSDKYHTMRQVNGGKPLLFTFPSASGRQDYHDLVESMVVERAMDPTIFALPEGCQTRLCNNVANKEKE